MLHTIYAANGKVSHIHRRMCYWDYTEWITRSFVNKAKEGGHVKFQFIYLHIRTFPHEEQNHYKHSDPKYRCYSNGHYCTGWYRIRWQTCVEVACSVLNLNYVIVIYGGKIACSVLNLNYVTMIYEGKIACSALKVNNVIVIYGGIACYLLNLNYVIVICGRRWHILFYA